MQAGNANYQSESDLPDTVGLFPLAGALLLPGGNLPLNIFEPRYLSLIEDTICGNKVLGMIQPRLDQQDSDEEPALCQLGCLGRITAWRETGDGQCLINVTGIARFELLREAEGLRGYRRAAISVIGEDLDDQEEAAKEVDRDELLRTLKAFLEANDLEADWEGVEEAPTDLLVNSLSMLSPYGPAEKQALLEARDLKTRAQTLVAITEVALAKEAGGSTTTLQ
ncbi:MAG: LON peptidase substrate-binding domain-containing protein [Pseudomonadota bacterium]